MLLLLWLLLLGTQSILFSPPPTMRGPEGLPAIARAPYRSDGKKKKHRDLSQKNRHALNEFFLISNGGSEDTKGKRFMVHGSRATGYSADGWDVVW